MNKVSFPIYVLRRIQNMSKRNDPARTCLDTGPRTQLFHGSFNVCPHTFAHKATKTSPFVMNKVFFSIYIFLRIEIMSKCNARARTCLDTGPRTQLLHKSFNGCPHAFARKTS